MFGSITPSPGVRFPKPVYTVSGDAQSHTLGKFGDIVITVNRDPDDAVCFDHFSGVEIDGKALVSGTDFTAAKGSTVITIKSGTLETLAEGEHTVKVLFDDGEAETKITIKPAEQQTNPVTGDGAVILVWSTLAAVSGIVLAVYIRRKREEAG